MKVLVIGNGAREHALVWKFSESRRISGLYCAPGNAGTGSLCQNLNELSPSDVDGIVRSAEDLSIDLVFVGPETPLALGLVDSLDKAGIPSVGPSKLAARLESSKAFSKDFLTRHKIPTAEARVFDNAREFEAFTRTLSGPWVVKKSGLAAGKGVLESDDPDEILKFGLSCLEDDSVVLEEYLHGFEASIFTVSDGTHYKILPSAADYKKAQAGNDGPNTGGMGAICPVPWLERAQLDRIEKEIIEPTMKALKAEGLLYKGILYFGLMVTGIGPKVLEFNVRFGDPEAQVLIPLLRNDFCSLWEAVANGTLDSIQLDIAQSTAIGVVIASQGYPFEYPRDLAVTLENIAKSPNSLLFHALTYQDSGLIRTGGGRCFTAVGVGANPAEARNRAYEMVEKVRFEGAWTRPDIGANVYAQRF